MSEAERAADSDRRGRWLLIAGATVGILMAAEGIVGSGARPPATAGAIAVVNGQPLSRDAYERFVAAVAAERKTAVLPLAEQQRLLDRLIDEELLLQHGIGLGLARHEPTARRVIVQSVIASVTGAAEAVDPDEAALREFHAENAGLFARPGRVVVEALTVPVRERDDAEARALAERVAAALRTGAAVAGAEQRWPGVAVPPLPGGPLPIETVRRYLGPTAALRAKELAPGEVAEPFRASAGYVILRLLERTPDRVPPFEEVDSAVRAEWTRDQGERALRRFLDDLRATAELEVADLEAASRP